MENVFEGLEGVRVYIDDVIIWAETPEQLNSRVHRALQRVHKWGSDWRAMPVQHKISQVSWESTDTGRSTAGHEQNQSSD